MPATGMILILGTQGKACEACFMVGAADMTQERPRKGSRRCEQKCDSRR
jgi:hypothetical protein